MSLLQRSQFGHRLGTTVGGVFTPAPASAPTLAALLTVAAADRVHGDEVIVDADGSRWWFNATSVLAGDNVFVGTPAAGSGRWLRMPGEVDIALPFTFATVDATVLATVPTGARLKIIDLYWEIATGFTGGASSAIGASSGTHAGLTTKGDLLGGAAGDVAATLVAGIVQGTAGAKFDTIAHLRTMFLVPTDTLRFDAITSAFTAGAGKLHVAGQLLANAGQ